MAPPDCTDHPPATLQNLVTTSAALAELVTALESADTIGLDTEFLRERTYRPELCLVQVSTAHAAACIDPLAPGGLGELARVLAGGPLKVMHASRQDLEVLHPVAGLVRPVFDTQIAAALAGMPAQVGYGELVRRVLGQELSKAHTRTDWSRRPLSAEQVEYALDDVRFLLPLKEALEEQLERLGRLEWLREELAALGDPAWLTVEPEQAWLRVKGLRGLDAGRARLARAIGAWRERRAIERNRPRGWILDDASLREIVLRVPRTPEALAAIPEMPSGVVRHCGAELLRLVGAAEIPDPPPPPPGRQRPDAELNARVRKLSSVNQAVAGELGLSPEILATRRELEQLAEGRRDLGVLSGWRRGVVGERMLAAL